MAHPQTILSQLDSGSFARPKGLEGVLVAPEARPKRDFLTGEEMSRAELLELIEQAQEIKTQRDSGFYCDRLRQKTLALIFDKPSFRTRLSFSVAMAELGGFVIESVCS